VLGGGLEMRVMDHEKEARYDDDQGLRRMDCPLGPSKFPGPQGSSILSITPRARNVQMTMSRNDIQCGLHPGFEKEGHL
jgi:hypothetical protein